MVYIKKFNEDFIDKNLLGAIAYLRNHKKTKPEKEEDLNLNRMEIEHFTKIITNNYRKSYPEIAKIMGVPLRTFMTKLDLYDLQDLKKQLKNRDGVTWNHSYNTIKAESLESKKSKQDLIEDIHDALIYTTDNYKKTDTFYNSDIETGEWKLYVNNTDENEYADNMFHFILKIEGNKLPIDDTTDIDVLDGTILNELKPCVNRIKKIQEVKDVFFSYYNDGEISEIDISITTVFFEYKYGTNDRYNKNFLNRLKEYGFKIGRHDIYLEIKADKIGKSYEKNIILKTQFPDPIEENKDNGSIIGWDCFTKAKEFKVLLKSGKSFATFNIDERGFNSLRPISCHFDYNSQEIRDWIIEEFGKMKKSNKGFYTGGYDKGDGKLDLYAHDFFIWLKNSVTK